MIREFLIGVGGMAGFMALVYAVSKVTAKPVTAKKRICKEGSLICKGYDLYVCSNNRWVLLEKNSSKCGYKPPKKRIPKPKPKPVKYRKLNYGYIELYSSGYYHLVYSGVGYGCNLTSTKSGILEIADRIKAVANSNIEYLTKLQNYIKSGKCVGECKNSKFIVQDTCDRVRDACEKFQGGFIHFWTVDELESLKKPYYLMLKDVSSIKEFVGE